MSDKLSNRIETIRRAAGDTPASAAEKLGISRQAYVKWESGDTANMKLGNLQKFCERYHVDIADLICGIPKARQTAASYEINKISKEALAIAEYYDRLPDTTRAEFMVALAKSLIETRIKNPDAQIGDIAEILDLVR